MAAPRLLFLWPMLRNHDIYSPAVRTAKAAVRIQAFHSTTARRQQETVAQRYGSANEPPPHLGGGRSIGPSTEQAAKEQTKLPKIGEKLQSKGEDVAKDEQVEDKEADDEVKIGKRTEPNTVDGGLTRTKAMGMDPMLDAAESRPNAEPPGAPDTPAESPLHSMLDDVPSPIEKPKDGDTTAPEEDHPSISFEEHSPPIRAPHMEPPRHVHHFDTYGLVKRLADAGWSDAQAITIMKAMRLILAENMDLAREALVSKSNVENETYLFRAACAELKTEVTSRRKAEQEKMRTERTQLQHEVDILGQRLGQETQHLKDELKGMFDDRKLAVRNEQRAMESKAQQLNYKITVSLQADARSDVEGLRWVMTRRVIIALGVIVIMVLGSLRLYSNAMHERELDAKRRANMKSGGTQTDEGSGDGSSGDEGNRRESRRIGEGDVLVKDGENAGFVSLG